MKTNTLQVLVTALLMFFAVGLVAQDQIPVAWMSFMDAEDAQEYIQVEREIWKPIHAKRIADGELYAWYCYQVVSPFDPDRGYNFITIDVYPNWDALENPYGNIQSVFEEVHSDMSMSEMGERTEASRKIVKQELWSRRDFVSAEGYSPDDVKYLVVDWMDVHPGHFGEYMRMEIEEYKPFHQVRVQSGNILSWGLFTRVGGWSESPGSIDAATSAAYKSWSDIWNSAPDSAWETAHPGGDQQATYDVMRQHRVMTGSVILRLVDQVVPGG